MKWASSLSTARSSVAALDETTAALRTQLEGDPPHLLLLFVSSHHAMAWTSIAEMLRDRFPTSLLLGCSAGGVIGAGREVERTAALSLTAAVLPGVELHPFHVDAAELRGADGPGAWRDAVGLPDDGRDASFIVLSDPLTFDAEQLVRGLDAAYPGAVKVGGLASGGNTRRPGAHALFLGAHHPGGAVGIAMRGDVHVDTIVAQGCRAIGNPMFVTRASRNFIFQLDGRPAVQAIEELFSSLDPADQALFRESLFLGISMRDDRSEYRQGDFLVRNVLGVDTNAGALGIAAVVEEQAVVQFHVRDARTSAEDLDALLVRAESAPPAGALLFSCLGRGEGLYGKPDHDTTAFKRHVGPVPIGGFFCNGEIGPVQGKTFLHGYTSCFGLFRPR